MSSAGWTIERFAAIRWADLAWFKNHFAGDAAAKATEHGIIGAEEFPLMRHLHSVVGLDEPLDMPWSTFFGGEKENKAGKG